MKRKVFDSLTKLSFKLYDALSDTVDKENVIFSPASVFAAIAMTSVGARGCTADEFMTALGIHADKSFHEAFSKIWLGIHKAQSDTDLNVVNRLWIQNGFHIENEYSDLLAKYYKADIGDVDFVSSSKEARDDINKWVQGRTKELIKNAVDETSISSDTRLIITNTIYFRGEWLRPFACRNTKEMPFHINGTNSCNVDMMYQKASFGYVSDEDYNCEVLIARYKNSSLRMVVVLPNKIDGLQGLENKIKTDGLDEDIFNNWVSAGLQQIEVYMPKFKFSNKYDLINAFRNIGVTNLFTSGADLSGISSESMHISSLSHQSFIEVNEEGTEACAVTGSTIKAASGRTDPIVFKADHPFMFLIIDNDTYVTLFWGRFCKPD